MELPELYAGASPFQKRDAVHVLTQYLPQFDWAEGDAVLDFGCGDGDLTEYLARCIPRLEKYLFYVLIIPSFVSFVVIFLN